MDGWMHGDMIYEGSQSSVFLGSYSSRVSKWVLEASKEYRRLDGDRLRGIKRRDLGGYQKRIIEKYVR